MDQMTDGTKVPVTMALDADLVREACALAPDLSATVERLLAEFVAAARSKRDDEQRRIDAVIAWHNDLVANYGLPGEDFMPL